MFFKLKIIRSDQDGASAVEFSIVLMLLLTVIFGIIEWGLFLFNKQVITNATREGARRGVIMRKAPRNVITEDSEIRGRVVQYAGQNLITFGTDILQATSSDIIITRPDFKFETNLQVSVNYEYKFLFLDAFGIDPIIISAISNMKME